MSSKLKSAFLFLILVFAVLALFAILTNSIGAILAANPIFLAVACLFFIVSILLWLFAWASTIKKRSSVGLRPLFLVGFSSVYASLTPLQLGTDALRALMLKKLFRMPYSESLAASMVVKGIKFFLIAILASIVMALFFFSQTGLLMRLALLSGFCIIALAAALFLLPMHKKIGLKIAGFFAFLSRFWKRFSLAQKYFVNYAGYLETTSKKTLGIVLVFAAASLLFEFLALFFSFGAAYAAIPISSLLILFVLINILERAPFLPRGIGLVEAAGFVFLSSYSVGIGIEKIATAIILFDIARLVVPTIASIIIHGTVFQKFSKNHVSNALENKVPEQAVQENN